MTNKTHFCPQFPDRPVLALQESSVPPLLKKEPGNATHAHPRPGGTDIACAVLLRPLAGVAGPISSIGTGHDALNTVVLRRRESGKPILDSLRKPMFYQGVPMVEGVGAVIERSMPATVAWAAPDLLRLVERFINDPMTDAHHDCKVPLCPVNEGKALLASIRAGA